VSLYSFKCKNTECNHVFDEIMPVAELHTKVITCPKCGEVAKLEITGPRVHSSARNWRT
jgi:putative FmdB family regulatory protein